MTAISDAEKDPMRHRRQILLHSARWLAACMVAELAVPASCQKDLLAVNVIKSTTTLRIGPLKGIYPFEN